jgi:hypothetical protein
MTSGTFSENARITTGGALCVGRTALAYYTTSVFSTLGGAEITSNTGTVGAVIGNSGTGAQTYAEFWLGYATVTGSITTNGTITLYNTTSDQRLKTNIADAPSGNIDSIKVRSFNWLADGSHQEFGLVAQELVEVAPYAVHQPSNTEEMMQVDYSKLVPMMIKEIQELKQRIKTLEN